MFRRVVCTIAIAIGAAACFEPPTTERQQADAALTAARDAGAATYASDTLATAEAALARYDAAVAERDYRQALRLAIEARDAAYEAARRATVEKTAAETRAAVLARQVETLIQEAERRASEGGTPRARAERLRAAVRTATAALQEARSQTGAMHYREAIATLEPVQASLTAELEPPAPVRRRR